MSRSISFWKSAIPGDNANLGATYQVAHCIIMEWRLFGRVTQRVAPTSLVRYSISDDGTFGRGGRRAFRYSRHFCHRGHRVNMRAQRGIPGHMELGRVKDGPQVRRFCLWTKHDAFPLCPLFNSVYSVAKMSNLRQCRASDGGVTVPDKPYMYSPALRWYGFC